MQRTVKQIVNAGGGSGTTETTSINAPRVPNIFLLPKNGQKLNLRDYGLLNATFNRYLSAPYDQTSGILQTLDITLYSRTGNDVIGMVQKENSNLVIQYGFGGEQLSPVYDLKILKIRTSRQESGKAISLGAVAIEQHQGVSKPEIYKEGTKISDILKSLAKRNNWQTDIDCNLRTPKALFKEAGIRDSEFIYDQILPIANKAVMNKNIDYQSTLYWEFSLFKTGPTTTLVFRPKNKRGGDKRVWQYEYGTGPNNQIISFTQELDMSHLINGLTIQVSANELERTVVDENNFKEEVNRIAQSLTKEIKEIHDKYNIPMLNIDYFKFNVELVHEGGEGSDNIEELLITRIIAAIDKAVSMTNVIDMVIIGNPEILPTDLIELTIKNQDGTYDWLTTPAGMSSYWKVIGIKENIGIGGYTTELKLVREILSD